eukprot:GHVH01015214.1.p1 GENE.GHVH01015214.1~~GHVH01015214.1.p1  ORF type:complete len:357 (+),score=38.61 GHVH01015214.1:553-1623(+)
MSSVDILSKISSLYSEYPRMNDTNTILFLGAYWERRLLKLAIDDDPSLLPKMPTVTETSVVCRLVHHPYQVAMPMNVDDSLCFRGGCDADKDFENTNKRLDHCDVVKEHILSDSKLSNDAWLQQRPYKMQFVGSNDEKRAEFQNRNVFSRAIANAHNDGVLDDILEPSIVMMNDRYENNKVVKGPIADQCRDYLRRFNQSDDLTTFHQSLFCPCGSLDPSWKRTMSRHPTVNWDIKMKSRIVLSLRGDTLGSQRMDEGLFFGSLTWHDQPLKLLALTNLPMPNHVPWRLTGFFDDQECLNHHVDVLLRSYRSSFSGLIERVYGVDPKFKYGHLIVDGKQHFSSNHEKLLESSLLKF